MSLLTFLLMLLVIGAVIWGVQKALAGAWRELIYGVIILIAVLWIFTALGVTLPTLPTLK